MKTYNRLSDSTSDAQTQAETHTLAHTADSETHSLFSHTVLDMVRIDAQGKGERDSSFSEAVILLGERTHSRMSLYAYPYFLQCHNSVRQAVLLC